jgi:hypothetical protein
MTQTPTKAELDRRLAQATRAIKAMDANAAKAHCAGERAWMETNWHPAVAKGAVDILRAEYRKRFKS